MKYSKLKDHPNILFLAYGLIVISVYYLAFGNIGSFSLESILLFGVIYVGIFAVVSFIPIFNYRATEEVILNVSEDGYLEMKQQIRENGFEILAEERGFECVIEGNDVELRPEQNSFIHRILQKDKIVMEELEDFETSDREVRLLKEGGKERVLNFKNIDELEKGIRLEEKTYSLNRINLIRLELISQDNPERWVEALGEAGIEVKDSNLELELSVKGFQIPDCDIP